MEKMKFLDIPGEVLTHHLFPLLEPTDISRLRRVCKPLKLLADDHLRLKVRNNRLLLVGKNCDYHFDNQDEDEEKYMDLKVCDEVISMKTLVNMECHLPVARVALNFDKWDSMFVEDEDEDNEWSMKEFLEKYGRQITELKLARLSVPLRKEKEIAFFEALPNLTRLTIEVLKTKDLQGKLEDKDKFLLPKPFKSLKHFKISHFILSKENNVAEKEYFWKMVEHCQALEVLGYPRFKNEQGLEITPRLTALSFQYLGGLLQNGRLTSLKYYDLQSNYLDDLPIEICAELCAVCLQHDVKLLNVESLGFAGLNDQMFLENGDDFMGLEIENIGEFEGVDVDLVGLENIGRSTLSLKELSVLCFMVPFPHLEKLQLYNYHSMVESEDGQTTWRQFGVPMWPKLWLIDFAMQLTQTFKNVSADLFHILFEAHRRPTVTYLRISIIDPYHGIKYPVERETPIHPPLLKKVAWSCFNLRKVQFFHWTGTNKALSIFWEKLPLLEDVCIENSPKVGNSAFVGMDLDKPVFLGLKNLKRFCLLNVQNMEKITDTVFTLVFRHMKIKSFHLTSWNTEEGYHNEMIKIKSITKEGIRSLLTSNFANHIARFPFNTWMLDDMDEEEFHQLRDEFRSAQMH